MAASSSACGGKSAIAFSETRVHLLLPLRLIYTTPVQRAASPSSTFSFVYGIIISFVIISLAFKYCTYLKATSKILYLQNPFHPSVIKLYTEHRVAPGKYQTV